MEKIKTIYTKEELESMAENINAKFFPNRLKDGDSLDPYDLLEKMGCSVAWKYVSPDSSVLGLTFFGDGYWYIWDNGEFKQGDVPKVEQFKDGTIVINQVVLDSFSREHENFIVAHELSHWIKDKGYFMSKESDDMLHICKKNDFEKTNWHRSMTELEIIEKQTNYLAAAILMPKEVVKQEFFRLCRFKNIPKEAIEYKVYMKKHIGALAKKYKVNFNPMLYRLMNIGVLNKISS